MSSRPIYGKPTRRKMTQEALLCRLESFLGVSGIIPLDAQVKDLKIEGLAKEFFIEYTLMPKNHRSDPDEERLVLIVDG